MTLHYSIYVDSHPGGRSENQDMYAYKETASGLLVVVCDGMGGTSGGQTAAHKAVSIILDEFIHSSVSPAGGSAKANHISRQIVKGIKKANEAIYDEGQSNESLKNMGTTVAALLLQKNKASFFHVGDSRIYQIRNGNIINRTKDHSRVAEMVKRGILSDEQARLSDESNILLRALGISREVEVDITENIDYEKGDRFFLCSDGIWGAIPETGLIKTLSLDAPVDRIVPSLINDIDSKAVKSGGGHDNMTAALIEAGGKIKSGNGFGKSGVLNVVLALLLLGSIGYIVFLKQTLAETSHPAKEMHKDSLKTVHHADTLASTKELNNKLNKLYGTNKKQIEKITQLIAKLEAAYKTDTAANIKLLIKSLKSEIAHIPVRNE